MKVINNTKYNIFSNNIGKMLISLSNSFASFFLSEKFFILENFWNLFVGRFYTAFNDTLSDLFNDKSEIRFVFTHSLFNWTHTNENKIARILTEHFSKSGRWGVLRIEIHTHIPIPIGIKFT